MVHLPELGFGRSIALLRFTPAPFVSGSQLNITLVILRISPRQSFSEVVKGQAEKVTNFSSLDSAFLISDKWCSRKRTMVVLPSPHSPKIPTVKGSSFSWAWIYFASARECSFMSNRSPDGSVNGSSSPLPSFDSSGSGGFGLLLCFGILWPFTPSKEKHEQNHPHQDRACQLESLICKKNQQSTHHYKEKY